MALGDLEYLNGNQNTPAAPATWNGLKEASIDGSSYYVKLNDPNGAWAYNGTLNAGLTTGALGNSDAQYGYTDGQYHGGGLLIDSDSRMVFDTKIKVAPGTVLSIVGATDDSTIGGGKNINDGYSFYWTVVEFDEWGYAIYDGDWRDTKQTWKVGYEENGLEGDEESRAPSYKGNGGKELRAEDVAYVMVIVRIASGDKTQGAGEDLALSRKVLREKFPNMYVVGQPFQYVFQGNEGTIDGSARKTLYRMGITPYAYNKSTGTVITSEFIKLPTATRKGYDFIGWKVGGENDGGKQKGNIYHPDGTFYRNNVLYSGEGDILSNGLFYSSLFEEDGTTSFEAQWKPTKYTITYNLQGGTVSTENRTSYTIETDTFTLNNPTKPGYEFLGWTGSNGTTPQKTVTITKGSTGDRTYTANWKAIDYTITYDLQGGSVTGNPTTYNIDTPTFTLKNPTRAGYKFLGWTGSNGATKQTTVTVTKGTTGDLSYTAHWEADKVDVTVKHYVMDVNGNFPANPTKTGTVSLIVGKSFEDDYGAEYFKDSSLEQAGIIHFTGYEFPDSGVVSATASENVVKLYYSRKVYTITFNVAYNGGWWNAGFVDREDVEVAYYYGQKVDLNAFVVTKGSPNWSFIGWNPEADARTGITSYTVTGNATLYAQYVGKVTVGFTDAKGREEIILTLYNKETGKDMKVPYLDEYSTWTDVEGALGMGWTSETDVNASDGTTVKLGPGSTVFWGVSGEYYGIYKGYAAVTFDENGGKETETTKDQTVAVYRNCGDLSKTKGGEATLPDCARDEVNNGDGTITSYTLAGWTTDGADFYPIGGTVGITKSTEFIAIWDEKIRDITYTIVFDMNGGKDGPDPITVKYNQEVTLPDKGSRVGFKLIGWCTTPDGTGVSFKTGDVVKNLTVVDGAVVTLYAQWRQRDFMLVKVGSNRYGATFVRRSSGDEEWFCNTGKLTIDEWQYLTKEECEMMAIQKWMISKEGTIDRVK